MLWCHKESNSSKNELVNIDHVIRSTQSVRDGRIIGRGLPLAVDHEAEFVSEFSKLKKKMPKTHFPCLPFGKSKLMTHLLELGVRSIFRAACQFRKDPFNLNANIRFTEEGKIIYNLDVCRSSLGIFSMTKRVVVCDMISTYIKILSRNKF